MDTRRDDRATLERARAVGRSFRRREAGAVTGEGEIVRRLPARLGGAERIYLRFDTVVHAEKFPRRLLGTYLR